MTIRWRNTQQVSDNMALYRLRILQVTLAIADYFAALMEAEAKANATWTDRTGNARQGLLAFAQPLAEDVVALYLTTQMTYGVFLETRWSGRFGIIWDTIVAALPHIKEMLDGAFGGSRFR